VCSVCNAATRAKQIIWYEPTLGGRLELEAGTLLENDDNPDQIITISPDLPAKADAKDMREAGGSPFLMLRSILGENFINFNLRLKKFIVETDEYWVNARRWIGYYLDRNWRQFDKESERLIAETQEHVNKEWKRHDVIHRFIDVLFAPLWIHPYYPEMKAEWGEIFNKALKKPAILKAFVIKSVKCNEILDRQRDIFHCLEQFMENRSGILPGLAAEMYPAGQRAALKELKLFRDEFPQLRDTYISTFEACHNCLKLVFGIINIAHRTNSDDFEKGEPKNLAAFEKLPNARKVAFLKPLKDWHNNWEIVLDRRIRNAIGHHSVRHNLSTGMLILNDGNSIPYLEFVVKTLRLIHPILLIANILKTFLIAISLDSYEAKPPSRA
jgi:hypothetical protein